MRQNRGNYTLPWWHIWCHNLDIAWLKQPQLSPNEAEIKRSRSPAWQKLLWWKLNAKETQPNGSNKKPSMLKTGTAKTNSAESSHGSVSGSRPPVKVKGPRRSGWKDIWLTNLNSFTISSFLSPWTPCEQVSRSGCSWGTWHGLLPRVSWRLHYLLCLSSCCPNGWGLFCP